MYTLGINAAFHDSAAALVKDGQVVAAAEEERFTRIKHAKRPVPFSTWELPFHAIEYCLKEGGITSFDIDQIGYSFSPELVDPRIADRETISLPLKSNAGWEDWEALFLGHIQNAPGHLASGVPHHLEKRFRRGWREDLKFVFVDHHLSHAASAFYPSPFSESAVMTIDGRGERATTSYSIGVGISLERLGQVNLPHSLGLMYEEITTHLGFLHSSDEYKVMAVASYGKPTYVEQMRSKVKVARDGQYTIEPLMLDEWFGPRRLRGTELEGKHFDLAHSVQKVLEETVLELCRWLFENTKQKNLCLAGGVALNCVLNAKIRDRSQFDRIWVQPASGDAGTALGAAQWLDAHHSGERRYQMTDVYLGPAYSDQEIEEVLRDAKVTYRQTDDIGRDTAQLLARDFIIGFFQGRMEFGPRSLGARSLLASPCSELMQAKLNHIKDREDFRPVAPVVLEEEADQWFAQCAESPFMLFVYDVLPEKASQIPAVRHTDGTARVQTVRADQNAALHRVLESFYEITGVPVLINTSFNTKGQPIVCSPAHALECFFTTPLDALVIGNFIIEK